MTTYQSLKEVVVALPSYAWPHAGKIEQRIKTEIGNKVKMAATSLPTPHVVCIGTHWVITSGAVSPPPLSIQDDAAVRRIVLKIIREESGD